MSNSPKMKNSFAIFLLVGTTNSALTLAIYWILLLTSPHNTAYLIAFIVGIIYSGILNSRFTFSTRLEKRKLVTYAVMCILLYFVNSKLLNIFIETLMVSKHIAVLLVIIASTPLNFLCSRYILKQNYRNGLTTP
jgi:putative flippase GtrA